MWNLPSCSVIKSCLILGNPMDSSTPGFSVLHYLLKFAQAHVHWISEAIQPSHPLPPSFPPAFSPRIRIFSNESALHTRWPKYWSFSFSISTSNEYWFPLGLTGWISLQSKGLSRVFSNTTIWKHHNCGMLPRPRVKPMSPALPGRFLTTGPQWKSKVHQFKCQSLDCPSGPVAKTLSSQIRGPGFNPLSGN